MKGKKIAVVAAAAAVVAALVVSTASAVLPSDGGGAVYSCSNSGTTPVWSGINELYSPPCSSNQTAFYAYQPGAPTFCQAYGYRAQIYRTDYTLRFDAYFCRDGLFHFSNAWSSNEQRFSWMRINSGGVDWAMIQYRR